MYLSASWSLVVDFQERGASFEVNAVTLERFSNNNQLLVFPGSQVTQTSILIRRKASPENFYNEIILFFS